MPEYRGREWPPKEGNKAAAGVPYWQHVFHEVFDGKDNENFLHKTMQLTKYTGFTSFMFSVAEITFFDYKGLQAARVIGKWSIPIIGGGLAYTTTVAFLGGIRNKTGILNHYLAGQMAGAVYGTYRRSFIRGLGYGMIAGLVGMLYKDGKIHGYTVVGDLRTDEREIGYSFSHKYDFTLIKDFPGYWVRKAPEDNKCE